MRIESLKLHHFGPFEDLEIEFPKCGTEELAEVHLLTGPNGCGKSSILYALATMFPHLGGGDLADNKTWELGNLISVDFGLKDETNIEITTKTPFMVPSHIMNAFFNGLSSQKEMSRFHSTLYQLDSTPHATWVKYFSLPSFCAAYSGNRLPNSRRIDPFSSGLETLLKTTACFSKTESHRSFKDWLGREKISEATAYQKGDLDKSASHKANVAAVEQALKDIFEFDFQFFIETEPELQLKARMHQVDLDFEALPDGVLAIMTWISDLFYRLSLWPWEEQQPVNHQPFFLLLDEIAIHLHPKWQRRILPAVQKLFPNAQIFATTHSPFVVNSVDHARVHRFELDEMGKYKSHKTFPSKAGSSYALVLDEIFGVDEAFDDKTQDQLNAFQELKKQVLEGNANQEALQQAGNALAQKSEELNTIVGRELRQVERLLKQAKSA